VLVPVLAPGQALVLVPVLEGEAVERAYHRRLGQMPTGLQ